MPSLQQLNLGAFVVAVAFLDDAIAYALGDGTVRLTRGDVAEGFQVHTGAILSAEPTRDGTGLLTGGDDGRVALTHADGRVEQLAERRKKWIDNVAIGPNGAIAFATGRQAVVRFADGRERSYDLPRAAGGLAFAPKGMRLAVARYDGVTLYWVGTDAQPVILGWPGAHLGVLFSPDGKFVVTSMQENALHGWRIEDGKDMRMSGYPAKSRALSWSVKGKFLATSGANAAILWPFHFKDGPMGKSPLQLGARDALVTRVACHPREEIVAVGYADGMVVAVRFGDGEEALLRPAGEGPVSALAWDGAGGRLAFGTEQGSAGIVTIA